MKTVVATMTPIKFLRDTINAVTIVTLEVSSDNGLRGRIEFHLSRTEDEKAWFEVKEIEHTPGDPETYRYKEVVPKTFRVVLDVPDNFPTYP